MAYKIKGSKVGGSSGLIFKTKTEAQSMINRVGGEVVKEGRFKRKKKRGMFDF